MQKQIGVILERFALSFDIFQQMDHGRRRDERRQQRVDGQLDLLSEELTLSAEQIDQVEKLLVAQMDRFRELREGDVDQRPRTRREWRERIREIRQDTRDELAKILNADQLATYDKLEEEDRGFGRRGRGR